MAITVGNLHEIIPPLAEQSSVMIYFLIFHNFNTKFNGKLNDILDEACRKQPFILIYVVVHRLEDPVHIFCPLSFYILSLYEYLV